MNEPGLVTISMNELRRVKIIESVVEGRPSGVHAAGQLGLSERQVSRLRRRFEAAGAAGLVSAKRGRPSNRQFPMNLRSRVLAIIRERYADFGPTLACEKLRECHGIDVAVETVRTLMMASGLWIARKQRPPKVYRGSATGSGVPGSAQGHARLKMVQAIVEMRLKPGRAAERLALSVRQVPRLVSRYRASGAAGFYANSSRSRAA